MQHAVVASPQVLNNRYAKSTNDNILLQQLYLNRTIGIGLSTLFFSNYLCYFKLKKMKLKQNLIVLGINCITYFFKTIDKIKMLKI